MIHPKGLTRITRGFTLIELLVVIAIIGLLASIILASLNTAQQKGRDARRVSDLQEIGQAIVTADSGGTGVAITGCANDTAVSTCVLTGATLTGYVDPSTATPCGATKPTSSSGVCNYTIYYSGTASTQNYEMCDVLENGSGTLPKGPIYIASSTAGSVLAGCP